MVKKFFLITFFISFSCLVKAQKDLFVNAENRIKELSDVVYSGKSDQEKLAANDALKDELFNIVSHKKSLRYPFENLDHISVIEPEDKSFRIFTWALHYKSNLFQYFGLIQYYDKKQRAQVVHMLRDESHRIKDPERKTLRPDYWYGSLYYDVVTNEFEGRTYYTLLGWDGNTEKSEKKIIDVLWFNNNKDLIFGAPLFISDIGIQNRFILEYNELATVTLEYKPKSKVILFDELEPVDGESVKVKTSYVPTLNYNGFIFKKGKWNLLKRLEPTELK